MPQSLLVQLYTHLVFSTKHRKTETFEDEFRRLCRKYGIEIDERYVCD